ncbi:rev protein [Human immunodeficiency virus 1]|uniref:Protein Rev n=1 Tax=Human immunodeficiency virus type 1 TaxID=11676 RepID=A0A0C5K9S0_HV1|nr:rev protein [Human immunodeficiency virus 1]
MAGRSGDSDEALLQAVRIIKILYQSNLYPPPKGTRQAGRNERRGWRPSQSQIHWIIKRILGISWGGLADPVLFKLPRMERFILDGGERGEIWGTEGVESY